MSQGINEVLGEFIEIYKSEPCLWKIKTSDYHDRDKKDAAYRKLVMKLKEIEPDANVNIVKKKTNNLRSNVRKEKKKIAKYLKVAVSLSCGDIANLICVSFFLIKGDISESNSLYTDSFMRR